jgi:excinuclease ABC subunit C
MDRPDLASIPRTPGVYSFSDSSGQIVYVGKAKSLHDRLTSYFTGDDRPARTARMLSVATNLNWVTCQSEAEALLLEREMISASQPRFNVKLRHGSGYPGLALTRQEVPRLLAWRGDRPARMEVFGPFPGAGSRALVDAVTAAFGVRSCKDRQFAAAQASGRACLLGETGHCVAPCLGEERVQAHEKAVKDARRLLSGTSLAGIEALRDRMLAYAKAEDFEAAGATLNHIRTLESLPQAQIVNGVSDWDGAVTALARDGQAAALARVLVARGRVIGVRLYHCDDDPELSDGDLTEQLAGQAQVDGQDLEPPTRGRKADHYALIAAFAQRQATEGLRQASARPWQHGIGRDEALGDLADAFELRRPPRRIEAIDVSHTGGRNPVASIVVMVDGVPLEREYRHVTVPDGGDDYQAVAHAVTVRMTGRRLGLPSLPDLLVIDGGAEQVAAAERALIAAQPGNPDLAGVELVGLAKRMEEAWRPGQEDPVILARSGGALRLLQLIRDEAHRTAIGRHRAKRDRAALKASLDDVPGLGPARRARLVAAFGTTDAVLAASSLELAAVLGPGVGPRTWLLLHGEP